MDRHAIRNMPLIPHAVVEEQVKTVQHRGLTLYPAAVALFTAASIVSDREGRWLPQDHAKAGREAADAFVDELAAVLGGGGA